MKKILLIVVTGVLSVSLSIQITGEQRFSPRPSAGPAGNSADIDAFNKAPLPSSGKERKILSILDEMYKYQPQDVMNVSREDGRLLRLLAESTAAKNVVEIGTANGYSGIWLSLALFQTGGKLTTVELNREKASLARLNFKKAGINDIITLIEGNANDEVSRIIEPIDILFLNTDNDGRIDYLDRMLSLVRPGGLIIARLFTAGQQDRKFIETVTDNPQLDSVLLQRGNTFLSVTLKKLSVSLMDEKKSEFFHKPDVPYVPTPQEVVDKMLKLAEVKKDDLVYDLGCGDGRIVIAAAKTYGCNAVGFDIDPHMVNLSRENVKKNHVENLVTIKQADIFTLDLRKADVITLFLTPDLNVRLIPQLEKCKPGTRIVSHEFDMDQIQADELLRVYVSEGESTHQVFLWIAPIKK